MWNSNQVVDIALLCLPFYFKHAHTWIWIIKTRLISDILVYAELAFYCFNTTALQHHSKTIAWYQDLLGWIKFQAVGAIKHCESNWLPSVFEFNLISTSSDPSHEHFAPIKLMWNCLLWSPLFVCHVATAGSKCSGRRISRQCGQWQCKANPCIDHSVWGVSLSVTSPMLHTVV